MHVEIHRASPVTIEVDGGTIETRTQARTVAQLLSEAGIELLGKDRVLPGFDAEIVTGMTVQVTRVVEAWLIESEDIPFETLWRSESALELDQRRTDQPGELGVRQRRVRIVYENGEEKRRFVADEWVERQPATRILSYGTKIVMREEETPHGVIRYWRKIRMLATSYSPSTAGKPLDHPLFGITRLGWQATKGVVAVDPRLVNLGSKVYVPGYGFGTAADTGGMIKGRRIDLCYDDDNLVLWKSWVDVYLLEPIPAATDINWVLLDFPTERR
jgi:3D (Asp-Asp-Asp) domain-containing protein